jgi:hypothetical protein
VDAALPRAAARRGLAAVAGAREPKWNDVADRAQRTFASHVWDVARGCLFDVADVDHVPDTTDSSLRPNQLLRRRKHVLLTDTLRDMGDGRASPERRIERLALRDWIWRAREPLPETRRVTALARVGSGARAGRAGRGPWQVRRRVAEARRGVGGRGGHLRQRPSGLNHR